MAEENKIHTTIRLSPSVIRAAKQYATDEGLHISFVIDRALMDIFGIRKWPERPKKVNKRVTKK